MVEARSGLWASAAGTRAEMAAVPSGSSESGATKYRATSSASAATWLRCWRSCCGGGGDASSGGDGGVESSIAHGAGQEAQKLINSSPAAGTTAALSAGCDAVR